MQTDLERRRQAIAAALRAVMAEPLPHSKPAVAGPPLRGLGARPLFTEAATRTVMTARVAMSAASTAASELPTFREALTSQIEWDEFDELPELADDAETPSVPPLEVAGSMSRAASVALFGHA
jgi:hypothetical protein